MANSEPTCELHLRMAGQPHDVTLRLHGDKPTEDDVAAWMKEGSVIRLHISETGTRAPHTMLVNFSSVAFAWLVPYKAGRGVDL
ncbi:hypothetical protein [Planotetraspora kaengkrachanensis]|uniref:Uncharacterized protein n=1 Tax=Planotetraspora kaengkrachanensis TaxID=575193 RepID=A0A8J3VAM6_9ACTN|nr:hypothetical protein [Planotetraspora kaengkrachanensis]GIG84100.1 hypothetical protein Pka01_72270 [Planotetraspora kaengkrachanensis]